MKRLRLLLASMTMVISLTAALVPATSFAAANATATNTPTQAACSAITGNNSCTDKTGGPSLDTIIKSIINILSLAVGVVSVIMIMVGGFRYITSGGDSNNVTSAKNTILYSVVGLVIVAMAQFIVQFVLHNVTKAGG
jgi:hypothetical protein